MGAGTEDKAQGKWEQVKGKVKEEMGDLADDPEMEAEGELQQKKGKVEEDKGHAKDAVEDVKDVFRD